MQGSDFFKIKSIQDIVYYVDGLAMTERWEYVDGYEGYYMVSDLGRVKSVIRKVPHKSCEFLTIKERILSQKTRKRGDLDVALCKDGVHTSFQVHRLVAKAFIMNEGNLPEVNHKFGKVNDNRATELEWMTASQNQLHSYRVLNRKKADVRGDKNPKYRIFLNICTGVYYTYLELATYFNVGISRIRCMVSEKNSRLNNFIIT